MKRGDKVLVYQDPLTELDFEGTAKIVSCKPKGADGLAMCMVIFDDDDPSSQHLRLIKAEIK